MYKVTAIDMIEGSLKKTAAAMERVSQDLARSGYVIRMVQYVRDKGFIIFSELEDIDPEEGDVGSVEDLFPTRSNEVEELAVLPIGVARALSKLHSSRRAGKEEELYKLLQEYMPHESGLEVLEAGQVVDKACEVHKRSCKGPCIITKDLEETSKQLQRIQKERLQ